MKYFTGIETGKNSQKFNFYKLLRLYRVKHIPKEVTVNCVCPVSYYINIQPYF